MIDILVPVLGRPSQAHPLALSVATHTQVPYTLLFLTSPGDTDEYNACLATGMNVLQVDAPERGNYAAKINAGYRLTNNAYLLLAADDLEFTPDWDRNALAVAEISGKGVIGTNDMANPHVIRGEFSTHPLIRRSYIQEQGGSMDGPGVVYHEGYDHNYVDRELCAVAMARNEWAFAIDSRVVHKRPPPDDTYRKGAKHFRQDHILFMQRASQWGHAGLGRDELRVARSRRYR